MIDIEDNLPEPDLIDAVIFNLDDTLALLGDRNPNNVADCYYDKLNHPIFRLLRKYERDNYKILIMTGRHPESFSDTLKWFEAHEIKPSKLYMRGIQDKRPEARMKLGFYQSFIEGKYNIEAIFESKENIARMWRSQGLFCLQAKGGIIE